MRLVKQNNFKSRCCTAVCLSPILHCRIQSAFLGVTNGSIKIPPKWVTLWIPFFVDSKTQDHQCKINQFCLQRQTVTSTNDPVNDKWLRKTQECDDALHNIGPHGTNAQGQGQCHLCHGHIAGKCSSNIILRWKTTRHALWQSRMCICPMSMSISQTLDSHGGFESQKQFSKISNLVIL